jgi:hypothetical protein
MDTLNALFLAMSSAISSSDVEGVNDEVPLLHRKKSTESILNKHHTLSANEYYSESNTLSVVVVVVEIC